MTVPATTRRSPVYSGNGVTTVFPFSFKVFLPTDIKVIVTSAAGVLSTAVYPTDYAVALNPDQTVSPGGSINYQPGFVPLPVGAKLVIIGNIAYSQTLALPGGGNFNPVAIENNFDRTEMQIQQLASGLDAAISVPVGETVPALPAAAVRAGYMLGFDSLGNPIAVAPASGSVGTLATDLANSVTPSKGAGQVGFTFGLGYAAATVGAFLNTVVSAVSLLTSAGAAMVGWIQAGTGAVYRLVQDELRDRISVKQFGAVGDGVADDTAAIQAALNRASTLVGAKVRVPRGTYKCTASLNISKYTQLVGEGRTASVLAFTNVGDGLKSTWPINSSTAVWIGVRDLALTNSNGANTGAGFVDVGGTFVDLFNVYISGFKFQVIFDQTEIASAVQCEFLHGSGQTGVWLVNGADHTALANKNFTNRIVIAGCQFNGTGSALENILDDGGVNHTIRDNNFNAGGLALRASAVSGLSFTGNESESHTSGTALVFANTTKAGAYVGACNGVDFSGGNTFSDATGVHVQIDEIQGGSIGPGNVFGGATSSIMVLSNAAANPTAGLIIEGNSKVVSGSGRTACIWLNAASLVPYRNVQFRQTPQTYVSAALAGTGSQVITPQTMESIHVGSRLVCQNQDGTSAETVIVTAYTGSTFTAVFTSSKNQANWCIYGATPNNEEEISWTPTLAGSGTAGAHTYSVQAGKYSRRGSKFTATFSITVTAKDGAMAGNLQIRGLPVTVDSAGNQIAICSIPIFSGFTWPANYQVVGGQIAPGASNVDLVRSGTSVALALSTAADIPGAGFTLQGVIEGETSSN